MEGVVDNYCHIKVWILKEEMTWQLDDGYHQVYSGRAEDDTSKEDDEHNENNTFFGS